MGFTVASTFLGAALIRLEGTKKEGTEKEKASPTERE